MRSSHQYSPWVYMLLELLIAGWITTLGAFHYFLVKKEGVLPFRLDTAAAIYAVNGEIKGCSVTCGSQVIIIQL